MANKDVETKVEGTEETKGTVTEEKKEEVKKSEKEKEFCLIRWAKAIGQACTNTGKAVNGFVHKHPYLTAGIGAGIGYGAKFAVDYFTVNGSSDDESTEAEVPCLPEPEDEEAYVSDLPDEEVSYEEEKTNEE